MLLKWIGVFFVGLAMLGAALPVLPTTPFLLVAAGCFAKSSPRLYNKLIENKVFGPLILDWRMHRTIPKRAKIMSLTSIVIASAWSCYILPTWHWQLLVIVLVAGPFIFIAKLPLSENRE